jgi:hypothetical protein
VPIGGPPIPYQMFDRDPVYAGQMLGTPAPRPQPRPAPPPKAAPKPPPPRPVAVPSPDELGIHLDPEFPGPDELGIGGLE